MTGERIRRRRRAPALESWKVTMTTTIPSSDVLVPIEPLPTDGEQTALAG